MKKNDAVTTGLVDSINPKVLKIMKISFFLLFVCTFGVNAAGFSQARITISAEDVLLRNVIREIESKSDYTFFYNEDFVDMNKKVTCSADNEPVIDVLADLGDKTGLDFKVLGNNLVVITTEAAGSKTVTGTVTDEKGVTLPGVSIQVDGTTTGTVTDVNGKYSIDLPTESGVLIFTFIGYAPQKIAVKGGTAVNVIMISEAQNLQETVVIGYGTQKKATVTGSIASIKGDKLKASPTSNLATSLQGRLPGLVVNVRSGNPGNEDAQILIRGKSTLGSNDVLTVVDGIAGGDITRLNPEDIESISILKDASAAIYGARAANGVILVTTKRGKTGKPTITYTGNYGITQPTQLQNLMDSWEYAVAENEYLINTGLTPKWTDNDITLFKNGTDPMLHPNEDWYDITLRKWTPQQQHNISVSGGNEAVKYFLSGRIVDQERVFKENDGLGLNRYQLRANIDAQVTKHFSLGLDMNYNKDKIENAYDGNYRPFYAIRTMLPNTVAFWPNGLPGNAVFGGNPALMGSSTKYGYNRENTFGFSTKLTARYDLSQITDGLFVEGFANFGDGSQNFEKFFLKSYFYNYDPATGEYIQLATGQTTQAPELRETNNRSTSATYNFRIGYQHAFGNHTIDAFASAEQSAYRYSGFWAYRKDYLTDQLPVLSSGSNTGKDNNGYKSDAARQNYFGRVNYGYKGKYLATATIRYDGSQNFPENNRFGLFPGISAGWVISEESFLKESADFIKILKVKASWGKMGNDAVPPYQYLATYKTGGGYYFGTPSTQKYIGYTQATTPNPDITWEVADTRNIGIESNFWNGLLGFNFDVFKSKRSNILTKKNASTPDYTGLILPDMNIGEVENSGFELELTHTKVIKDFMYSVSGNMSYSHNKVLFLDESADVIDYQKKTDRPIDSWMLYKSDGIYQTQAEIDATPHLPNTAPGDIKYLDVSGDGKIDGSDMVREDLSPTPQIMYGINLYAKYKNLELSVLLQGQGKCTVVLMPQGLYMDKEFFDGRWQKQGDNLYPRSFNSNRGAFGNNALVSDFWTKNGSFLRLKNVELAYTLPKKITEPVKLSNVRVFVSGSNLMLIYSKIKIVDPETLSNTNGESLSQYPIQRMVSFGVSVSL